ncbi:MAG: histidine phosphatase family protein [Micrococcales bacterium]|nr:histidine phosphatase family protein [Micrococcales bacterium]MCL2666140.1 histidine phosphatase family protein [Micrococcales bacterium]
MVLTTVHLLRHGEVHNPEGVLYGRLQGYRLSDLGERMAQMVADDLASQPAAEIALVVASPLERAQQTAAPVAAAFGLDVGTDDRLIEAANYFEGKKFGVGEASLANPRNWPHLRNPFRPSWGEPYAEQVARMRAAVTTARRQVPGREVVLVSHQLPIWVTRLAAEGRRLWHDPRRRRCTLASLTTLRFDDDHLVGVGYREPAATLVGAAAETPGA